MQATLNTIKKRQKYYRLGIDFEKEKNYLDAINCFLEYSNNLSKEDKHIPMQWISKLFNKIGESELALFYLEEFAKGCSKPKAAELFKSIAEKYLELENTEKAISNFKKALENDPMIGVKIILTKLENQDHE